MIPVPQDSPPARSGGPAAWRAAGVALGMLVLGYIAIALVAAPRMSGDLLPLWLAGEAFAGGGPVYAPADGLFRMLPPEGWTARAAALGHEGHVYPFVYPPLWAWVFGGLTRVTDFATVAAVAGALNTALLVAMPLLARRAAGAGPGVFGYLVISQVLIHMTPVGMIALYQNQSQILVAFLVVLALERAEAGRPASAGAAMALAASIKLFPAAFALIWLVSGERRAFASFAAVGLALGLVSVAVAGWPLHAAFLGHVAAIGETGFFSALSFSLDAVAARLAGAEPVSVPLANTHPGQIAPQVIAVSDKPAALVLAGKAAVVAAILGLGLAMRRAGRGARRAALWPAALTLLPLLGPIAWGYYFLAATAFAPVLLSTLGRVRGGAILCLVYAPLHMAVLNVLRDRAVDLQVVGALLFLFLAAAFLASARTWRDAA
ncbi:glycosyltransferase family 87 protein [Rhodovulum marinum]|uniref:Uncharacterized protein DUF2029 n=1 Tax=Rhodovulum marinum TaxID=320662 RepID=A0A4R2Q431_9RHOB|nr:glycosyltransferase family 87 protein [Rhodovulum marinum]TCP41421.1 uncharacterized protein DUF2029 [Rhodovulum marinum]